MGEANARIDDERMMEDMEADVELGWRRGQRGPTPFFLAQAMNGNWYSMARWGAIETIALSEEQALFLPRGQRLPWRPPPRVRHPQAQAPRYGLSLIHI